MADPVRGLLIADFTADMLAGFLQNDPNPPAIELRVAPYDQVTQVLVDPNQACWREPVDFAIAWTRPESAVPGFGRLAAGEPISPEELCDQVDQFADRLKTAAGRVRFMLVPTWAAPWIGRGLGLLDLKHPQGLSGNLHRMNLRLIERLSEIDNIYPLDTQRWLTTVGADATSPKLWYLAKSVFGNRLLQLAAEDIRATVRSLAGEATKLIILDLDDTLWGGLVGEVGWENIQLGGHDPIGEAFADFQRSLKALSARGILLALASKNDEAVALKTIRDHPEMILRENDFVARRINWRDKAANILELLTELNLGPQSGLFIDDSRHERSRVRDAIPELQVPEWPDDRMLYATTLRNLTCFDTPSFSDEDRRRTAMYSEQKQRTAMRTTAESLDDWLGNLGTTVTARRLDDVDRARTVQLLNKTNQMNLATRRMTSDEFAQWADNADYHVLTIRVDDKLGDSGLTGLVSLAVAGDHGQVCDFILSCRVMGRRIEATMLHLLAVLGHDLGLQTIELDFQPTQKNLPCLDFLRESGLKTTDDRRFVLDVVGGYPLPECIQLSDPIR